MEKWLKEQEKPLQSLTGTREQVEFGYWGNLTDASFEVNDQFVLANGTYPFHSLLTSTSSWQRNTLLLDRSVPSYNQNESQEESGDTNATWFNLTKPRAHLRRTLALFGQWVKLSIVYALMCMSTKAQY